MNIRQNIRRHVASAVAAFAVSAFFIGATVMPVSVQATGPVQAQQPLA